MSVATPNVVLRVRNLSFSYPGERELLTDWSADIGPGVTLLQGDTGSGKSTLLRLLGAEETAAGELVLGGVSYGDDPGGYRRQVFLCDPSTDAFDKIAARECTQALCAGDTAFDVALWESLIDGFALVPHIEKPVYMLSTGSKRKLWLAAALAASRRLTLLDEPAAALDTASMRCLWEALNRLTASPLRAVLVASAGLLHEVPLAASIDLPPR